jgi:dTDP-4-dehydrorhamnose 3,5-epimerase
VDKLNLARQSYIDGVTVSSLKQINHPKGDILHAMKASNIGYAGFGEAYFSTVHQGVVKGWKKHKKMTMNLVVPVGEVRFVIFDDRSESDTKGTVNEVILSTKSYNRLTINPGLWMAFQGYATSNLILNIGNIEHDANETISIGLDEVEYEW